MHWIDVILENVISHDRSPSFIEKRLNRQRLDMPVITWFVGVIDSIVLGWLPLLTTLVLFITLADAPAQLYYDDLFIDGLRWLTPTGWAMLELPLWFGLALLTLSGLTIIVAALTWLGSEPGRRWLLGIVNLLVVAHTVAFVLVVPDSSWLVLFARVLLTLGFIGLNQWCFNHPKVRAYYG